MKRITSILLTIAVICTFIFVPLVSNANRIKMGEQLNNSVAVQSEDHGKQNGYRIGNSDITVPLQQGSADILNELGLFKGTENGYELERTVTRAEAITMILRMIGEERAAMLSSSNRTFADVDASHWAFASIGYAASKGYVQGTSATTFEPARNITGKEFVKMLLSAMGHEGVTIENAYDRGVKHALLVNNYAKLAVSTDGYMLKRNDVVNICYLSLLAKAPDGKRLDEVLVEKGAVSREDLDRLTIIEDTVVNENKSFSWNLNKLMPKDENYMFSPFSIKMALAMAAVGAEGETKNEILNTLGIDNLEQFNEFAKQTIDTYSRNEDVKLNIANSIWLNTDYCPGADFSSDFKTSVENYYNADSQKVNDSNAVQKINNWVKDKTNEKITEIIRDSNFLSCLVNAIYFKGEWAQQFNEDATNKSEFTDREGQKNQIDFMNMTGYFNYYKDSDVQMIKLPYKDRKTSMYVAITDNRDLELDKYIDKMASKRVQISMPKFKTEFSISLNDALKQLGINLAFDGSNANFRNMFVQVSENPFISEVAHKTFINVDENGTEAAAVTAIIMRTTSVIIDEPVIFNADRPFTYFIHDDENGEILFMGEYAYTK